MHSLLQNSDLSLPFGASKNLLVRTGLVCLQASQSSELEGFLVWPTSVNL
jgi:hypothetical protein